MVSVPLPCLAFYALSDSLLFRKDSFTWEIACSATCVPPPFSSTGRARQAGAQVFLLFPHLHTSWATEGVYEYIPKLQKFFQLPFILVLSIRNLLHPSAGPPPASSKSFNLLEDYVEELPPTRHGAELVPLPSHGHALCAVVQCGLLMSMCNSTLSSGRVIHITMHCFTR